MNRNPTNSGQGSAVITPGEYHIVPEGTTLKYFGELGRRFGYATGSSIPRGIGDHRAWRDSHPCLVCGAAVLLPGVHLAWHHTIEGEL